MEYSSQSEILPISSDKLYALLSDYQKFAEIIPSSFQGWSLTDDGFQFTLNGMLPCTLKINETIPYSQVSYLIESGKKLAAQMFFYIEPVDEGKSSIQIHISADVPPFMGKIIQKTIEHATESAVQSIKKRLN